MNAGEAEALFLDSIEEDMDRRRTSPVTPFARAAGRTAATLTLRSKGIDFARIGREFTREQLIVAFREMAEEAKP